MTIGHEHPTNPPQLVCPLCSGTSFTKEIAKSESRWGFTTHKVTMMICTRCAHILHFYNHRSIFDID